MEIEIVASPRIEIAFAPTTKGRDRFALWLFLHVPDGGPPTAIRLTEIGQELSRNEGTMKICEIFTAVGESYAPEGADLSPDRIRPS